MLFEELNKYKFSKDCQIRTYYKNKITPIQRIEKKNILRNFNFLKSSAEIYSVNYYTKQLCFLNKTINILPITPYPPDPYFSDEATMFLLKLYILLEYENVYMYKLESDKTILYYKLSESNVIKFLYLKTNKEKLLNIITDDQWRILIDRLLEDEHTHTQHINAYLRDKIEYSENNFENSIKEASKIHKGKTADIIRNEAVRIFFDNKIKKDLLYTKRIVNEYNNNFKTGNERINEIMKTNEYKDFAKFIKKKRRKYKINLRNVFDKNRRNITYKCFKEILDKFRAEYEKFLKTKEGKDFFNKK